MSVLTASISKTINPLSKRLTPELNGVLTVKQPINDKCLNALSYEVCIHG